VQQQQLWRVGWPGLAIENLETIDVGRAVSDMRHENPPSITAYIDY
jgi:hypothetical protein